MQSPLCKHKYKHKYKKKHNNKCKLTNRNMIKHKNKHKNKDIESIKDANNGRGRTRSGEKDTISSLMSTSPNGGRAYHNYHP